MNQNNQMIAAGQSSTANNPNAANLNLANLGAQASAQQINGVNPAILGAATGVGGGISNVGTYVAPGSNLPNPIVNIPAPVLPGGLNAIAGFGGPLNGAVSFGGHGGFFRQGGAVAGHGPTPWDGDTALIVLLRRPLAA